MTRRLLAGYGLLMAFSAVLYFTRPPARVGSVCLIGAASAGAVVTGVRRYRPSSARSWLMIAVALGLTATSRIVYYLLPGEPGTLKPWVWTVWLLDLTVLVLLVTGVLGLARSKAEWLPAAIDAAVILLGAGLLAGILVAIPYASTPGIGALWEAVRVSYVLRDVIILAVVIHLVTTARWTASVGLLFIGLLGFLSYDMLFRLGRVRGAYLLGTPIDLGWLLLFIAVGAAALAPSMALLGVRRSPEAPGAVSLRLGLVAIAALMPPAVLLVTSFELPPWYEPMIVAVATVVLVLVFIRMVDASIRLRRQVNGERILRDAIADLADAPDVASVTAALDRAVRRLLSPERDYQVALTNAELNGANADRAEAQLHDTKSLPPALATQLGASGVTLAIPLAGRSQPTLSAPADFGAAARFAGPGTSNGPMILLVRFTRPPLETLRARLDVLATQAALAIDRMRLQERVVRNTSEAYFQALVRSSTDVILIIDDDNRIRYASPSAEAVFGPMPLPGVSLPTLVEHADRAEAQRLLELARARTPVRIDIGGAGQAESLYGNWTVHAVGRDPAQVEVSCRDLRDDPSVGGLVVTFRDVTEQRRMADELAYRSHHDPLTGLANRLQFTEHLDAEMQGASDDRRLVALLFIDLDDFTLINDALGHEIGDMVLTQLAGRLRAFAADNPGTTRDLAARLGGDEFGVLLTSVADQDAAGRAADRLVAAISQPIQAAGRGVTCSASVGVATTAEDANSSAELLRHADLALYAARGAGKGRWRHYEPWMQGAVMEKLELRSSLERAIDDEALFLEYQPIVALDSERTVGFEALLRWHHPTRGRLGPDHFIDVAEESGLIGAISDWVLATATAAMQRWDQRAEGPYVAVNISASLFALPRFTAKIQDALTESGLAPKRLVLEITESLLLRDDTNVVDDLQKLRQLGIRVAIDDFGTGYSALSYLRQVPVDVVKLDRSFIQNVTDSDQQRQLVRGIVNLSEALGLHVVAEGIETDLELGFAKKAGCVYGQGYLFSRPMPEDAVPGWLAGQQKIDANSSG